MPEQAYVETDMVYCTVAGVVPELTRVSDNAPHPPPQVPFPVNVPPVTVEDQVNELPAEPVKVGLYASPVHNVVGPVTVAVGSAPTESLTVTDVPTQPNVEVGVIVYVAQPVVLPELVNV